MTPEEQAQLQRLEAENAALREQLAAALAELEALEGRLAQDSHNSSQPPSRDGLARKMRRLRPPSGKKPGGPVGHRGTTLPLVETPDQVVVHRPAACPHGQTSLTGLPAERVEGRQGRDLPPVPVLVTAPRAERVRCPPCQRLTAAGFAAGVEAPAPYGPGVRALAVYLSQPHLLPFARVRAVLSEGVGGPLSVGRVVSLVPRGAGALAETEAATKAARQAGPVRHPDQTPLRVTGQWPYVPVCRTARLPPYGRHPQRGAPATAALGRLPGFRGPAIHEGWTFSWHYRAGRHALCNVHQLRERTGVAEPLQQAWAQDRKDLLVELRDALAAARPAGATQVDAARRAHRRARSLDLLGQGLAANPLPPRPPGPPRRGRRKQPPVRNRLDRLFRYQDEALRFLDDFAVPFDNHQAERDLRLLKVQPKISGTFRSPAGAAAFCRIRGALSTLAKQAIAQLAALLTLFAEGSLPSIAAT
jgi:transposase